MENSTQNRRQSLIRLDSLSYAEIAERTGLSVAQVERLFAKALCNFSYNLDDPARCWRQCWFR